MKNPLTHFFSHQFNLLRKIFGDIFLLYRNFVHWVVHKIILKIYGFILGIIFALPFLLIVAVLMYIDPISWMDIYYKALGGQIYFDTLALLLQNLVYIGIEIFFLLTALGVFVIGWSYANVLQFNLYKNYLDGKKLGYTKNAYTDMFNVWTYIKLSAYIGLYWVYILLACITLCIVILAFGVAITGSMQNLGTYIFSNEFNVYSLLLLLCIGMFGLIFIYVNFRVYFASMFFVEDIGRVKKHHSAKHYIKQSIGASEGWKNIVYFLISMSIVALSVTIMSYPLGYVDAQKIKMEDYAQYTSDTGSIDTQDIDMMQYYDELVTEYQGLGYEQFMQKYTKYSQLDFFLGIFFFIIIAGVMEMAVFSFYRHQISKK